MISIDFKDRRPIYQQLMDRIEDLAAKGLLNPDTQLPSVRQLAIELSINPNTIQRAYAELEKRGVLYSVPGKGSFLSDNRQQLLAEKENQLLQALRDIFSQALELGISLDDLLARARNSFKEVAHD
ncbi:MAG: GntR family transcriptional regulator [Clostridia bacterium]|nr:GntR family transcriptional regulator [Clostridia bacterium]